MNLTVLFGWTPIHAGCVGPTFLAGDTRVASFIHRESYELVVFISVSATLTATLESKLYTSSKLSMFSICSHTINNNIKKKSVVCISHEKNNDIFFCFPTEKGIREIFKGVSSIGFVRRKNSIKMVPTCRWRLRSFLRSGYGPDTKS